jgi:cytochrome c-type biogenesis protein CcsB
VRVLYTEAAQLVPALKSYWLVIHVSAAVICGGAFTIAAGVTLAYLLQERRLRRTPEGQEPPASRLPSAQRLELLNYKILTFAFPLWTFAVVSGAIWAESAWGRYWGWDPKETWAFITWVIYAAFLHARTTAGWRGRRAAWISLVGFLAFLINYFGVNLFVQGLHSYKGF